MEAWVVDAEGVVVAVAATPELAAGRVRKQFGRPDTRWDAPVEVWDGELSMTGHFPAGPRRFTLTRHPVVEAAQRQDAATIP